MLDFFQTKLEQFNLYQQNKKPPELIKKGFQEVQGVFRFAFSKGRRMMKKKCHPEGQHKEKQSLL